MIVVFSKISDATTSDVIAWIESLGYQVYRINYEDRSVKIKRIDICEREILIQIGTDEINLMQAKSVWFRRNGISYEMFDIEVTKQVAENIFFDKVLSTYALNHLKRETESIINYIYSSLESSCKALGYYSNSELNKLQVLNIAQKQGLIIPDTFVTRKMSDVKSKLESNGVLITKALSNGIYVNGERNAYYTYTEEVNNDLIRQLNRNISHSLFQTQIVKQFEIRSFFLNGNFFSMAIFSQSNDKTSVDFRKYDEDTPNRTVPYKLPISIERKLSKLMNELNLNTGSIDMILGSDERYYFLEINPVGQFGMVSQPCNYYLERKVAEFLINP